MTGMNILFMGTPDFAARSLEALIGSGHNICGVVSQPDKPKGRGHKLTMPEVKILALENNIAVYQPQSLKNGELQPVLDELRPDMIVVAAYGKILPAYVIDYPKYGCINVHASLLPKYRGAAPIQRAVLNGEKVTGITTMLMDYGLDTGDILDTAELEIGPEETSAELFDRLAAAGGELLLKTVESIENGTAKPKKQNHDEHTYAAMIKKEEAETDWTKPAHEVLNHIRGMNSWPMAYTYYEGEPVKIISASAAEGSGEAGEILRVDKGRGLAVACGSGAVYVKEVQFAGSKRMNIEDYMRGHEIKTGARMGK